jgi:hypothetical protein
MNEERSASQVSWGARVNTRWSREVKDFPDWANPHQREKWAKKGLILWESESQVVLRLSATQALQLLDHFHTEDDWREEGIVLGEKVARLALGKPEQEPEEILINQIHLPPARSRGLLKLLERNKARLEKLREQEEEERKRARARVSRILLELAQRTEEESDTPEDQSTRQSQKKTLRDSVDL